MRNAPPPTPLGGDGRKPASYAGSMTGFADMGIRRVRTPHDWQSVRRLRFEGLASRGEIAPAGARSFSDAFDEASGTSTYLLCSSNAAIGTTRSSVSSRPMPSALPSQRVFRHEIEAAFGASAV